MQFMMAMYEPAEDFVLRTDAEGHWPAWQAYSAALREAGVLVGGNALKAPETARRVRLDEALAWAARLARRWAGSRCARS